MRHQIRLGYHKCMTVFFNRVLPRNLHFKADRVGFRKHLRAAVSPQMVSLNNQAIDLSNPLYSGSAIVHVMRHPKDLIVSGYHFHRKASEEWTRRPIGFQRWRMYRRELEAFVSADQLAIIEQGRSVAEMWNELEFEPGMMIEMVHRKYQQRFDPVHHYRHPNAKTFRFEDVVADPEAQIGEICAHFELSVRETAEALLIARDLNGSPPRHVRDRSPYQYREVFTPRLEAYFERLFPTLCERLDYENHTAG